MVEQQIEEIEQQMLDQMKLEILLELQQEKEEKEKSRDLLYQELMEGDRFQRGTTFD